jgi:glycosyltransferase involved in cell wall biosynthesis
MIDRTFTDQVDRFVYVSEWQKNQFQMRFPVDESKNLVIRNAIQDIEFKYKPTDKIRLIYTSMPNRGLEILLDAFELLNRTDVELIIYSSNIIYGKGYGTNSQIEQLFHRCKTMKNVIYKGFAMNQAVRRAVQQAHILAYPSIYEETSCLSAIEAGAAGCRIVTTNYGALSETCGEHATYVDYSDDRRELTYNYSHALNTAINNYSSEGLLEQSDWFNLKYSWDIRKTEWNKFFGEMK